MDWPWCNMSVMWFGKTTKAIFCVSQYNLTCLKWALPWKRNKWKRTLIPEQSLTKYTGWQIHTQTEKMLHSFVRLHKFSEKSVEPLYSKEVLQTIKKQWCYMSLSSYHSTFMIPVFCLHLWSGPIFFKQVRGKSQPAHSPQSDIWCFFRKTTTNTFTILTTALLGPCGHTDNDNNKMVSS